MRLEIEKIDFVNHSYFNDWLSATFDGCSSYCQADNLIINGSFNDEQIDEIKAKYSSFATDMFSDDDLMIKFLSDKYRINAETGSDYVFDLSAKMNLLIQKEIVTIEEAELYCEQTSHAINELKKGYFHSAYKFHVQVLPIAPLQDLHDEVASYLKNYVNEKYPENFHIE